MKLLEILTRSDYALSGAEIEQRARELGMSVKTVIPSTYSEIEYLAVALTRFKTAFFLMDNETFKYTYSHTYDAMTDKTTKRKPAGF